MKLLGNLLFIGGGTLVVIYSHWLVLIGMILMMWANNMDYVQKK